MSRAARSPRLDAHCQNIGLVVYSEGMTPRLRRLGAIVAARRQLLGMTRDQVREAGGPSDTRLASIEDGAGPKPSASTLAKLDNALEWVPGSAARTLSGGDPTALNPAPGVDSTRLGVGPDEVAIPIALLIDLITHGRAVNAALKQANGAAVPLSSIDKPTARLNAAVSRLSRIAIIDVYERNGGPGRQIPNMLELAFADQVDVPIDPKTMDRDEQEDRMYMQWLAHKPVEIPRDIVEQFYTRWSGRENERLSNQTYPPSGS
jgi:transcriptional regulator with XRE-family HTH domain